MKKAKAVKKKLELSQETLRQLSGWELDGVAAGGWSDDSICPSVNDVSCRCGG